MIIDRIDKGIGAYANFHRMRDLIETQEKRINELEKEVDSLSTINFQQLNKISDLASQLANEQDNVRKLMHRNLWQRIINKYTLI